ncbi:MAG: hypothetical protein HOU81_05785 [Hamadaea sp.]|uniref:DUF2231 domain-containing protein n=1 Tax=Hamadaea sp. TaxID=2024425 RepID=UPI0017D64CCC|nr:DUF2231 domain-containing protein [Hamadaea sp.]NUR70309.1 hypothetical protein [Hamadaea sp.]NUT21462.1 hypothetical protein [Hamadaea sp.]
MFQYILGIPAHPLIVHFAIVFVVLLVAGSAVYALVPPLRRRTGWAVGLLAVVGPIAAWVATESGEQLQKMVVAQGYPQEFLTKINQHVTYGDRTWYFSAGLGVATLLLVFVSTAIGKRPAAEGETRRGSLLATIGLGVIVLVLAGFTGYYLFKTGDTGAHLRWVDFAKK